MNQPRSVIERRSVDVAVLGDSTLAVAAVVALRRRGKKVVHIADLGLTAPKPMLQKLHPLHLLSTRPQLAQLANEASSYWRGLQAQAGPRVPLLRPRASLVMGAATSGTSSSDALTRMQEACKVAGVPLAVQKSDEANAAAAALRVPPGFSTLVQPGGGVLHEGEARRLLRSLATRAIGGGRPAMLRDTLLLRGWRDAGDYFELRCSSDLLPEAESFFEAEQLLVAPDGWAAREELALFGVQLTMETREHQYGPCLTAPDVALQLPVLHHLGGTAAATTDEQKQAVAEGRDALELFGLPMDGAARPGLLLATSANAGPVVPDVWAWQRSADSSGMRVGQGLVNDLMRGQLGYLDPASVRYARTLVTGDGLPIMGLHPGYQDGRIVVACTASGSAQHTDVAPAADKAAARRSAAPPGTEDYDSKQYEYHLAKRRDSEAAAGTTSSGGGTLVGQVGRLTATAYGSTSSSTADGGAAGGFLIGADGSGEGGLSSLGGQLFPGGGSAGGGGAGGGRRPLPRRAMGNGVDGFQLSPLLASMAADMVAQGTPPGDIDPLLLALTRRGVDGTPINTTHDTWEKLAKLQSPPPGPGEEQLAYERELERRELQRQE